MSDLSLRPGISLGSYPQRREDRREELEQAVHGWLENQRRRWRRKSHSQKHIVARVKQYEESLASCSDEALNEVVDELRSQLHRKGLEVGSLGSEFIRDNTAHVIFLP